MEYEVKDVLVVELDGETFSGRPLPVERVLKIQRRHTKTRVVKGVPVEDRDLSAIGEEIFRETVQGWEGPTLRGAPMDCNAEGKRYLYQNHPERAQEILEALQKAAEVVAEVTEKNS